MNVKRGEIYYCDLSPTVGSEQSGIRPVVIIQNDVGNKYSKTVIALAITSKTKNKLPTHISINGSKYGLEKDSIVLAEQVRTIDKTRLLKRIGLLDCTTLNKIKRGLEISFGIRASVTFDECVEYIQKNTK